MKDELNHKIMKGLEGLRGEIYSCLTNNKKKKIMKKQKVRKMCYEKKT